MEGGGETKHILSKVNTQNVSTSVLKFAMGVKHMLIKQNHLALLHHTSNGEELGASFPSLASPFILFYYIF